MPKGPPWTADEPRLIALWNSPAEVDDIAEALKRTVNAICCRATVLRRNGVVMRVRSAVPSETNKKRAAERAAEAPVRACNLCKKPWQPASRYERFCPACKHNGVMRSIRSDANWATF